MPPDQDKSGLEWLYSTQLFGIKLGLENVHRLLHELRLPPGQMKFIHVAGTNGKGSTCAFLHALLREAGIGAGLFTSPHLICFNERIQDSERMISDTEVAEGLQRLRRLVRDWQPHPTFFEITFALALDWFHRRGLEWVILETGMGGRLDATNAIVPAVSVITAISLDHMEFLGDTLEKIAAEKAGIIKPGVPVVTTAAQEDAVRRVLEATAKGLGVPLQIAAPLVEGAVLGLPGPHQRENAALAVEALQLAGVRLTAVQRERGLAAANWPGRFQWLGNFVLDGAHNPAAAQVLVQTWQEAFPGERAIAVIGVSAQKDVAAMLRILAPMVKEWRFIPAQSSRALPPEDLHRAWLETGLSSTPVTVYGSLAAALADGPADRCLIAGSLFVVGEALAFLRGNFEKFQASGQ